MNEPEANPFIKIKAGLQRNSLYDSATQIQSECPRCKQNGMTTILLASIPLFREIMLCSFICEHCGERNNEVQFAGRLPDFGVEILFRCLHINDMDREVIKSDHCIITFEELDLQIPSKKAEITTIESLLKKAYEDLTIDQTFRKTNQPEKYQSVQIFLQKLKNYCDGKQFPLTIKLKDPSGNSNIKNPFAPRIDKNMEIGYFRRTMEELKAMGYSVQNAEEQLRVQKEKEIQICGNKLNFVHPFEEDDLMKHEALGFEVPCDVCLQPGQMKTYRVSVPYFEDLVIMSFTCDHCGHHTAETKNSGVIGAQALIITLNVENEADLKRDLFKSQTCYVSIPQLELQLDYGTLGGVFTTVEGLLQKINDHLSEHNPFVDSDHEFGVKMRQLLQNMIKMRNGQRPFTLILVDPLARSFLQNPYLPAEDKNAKREMRDRTFDQNQTLGLNDIKVQNYN